MEMAMQTVPQVPNDSRQPVHPGRIAGGAVFIAVGISMLLDRTEQFGPYAWQAFPGMILIMFGVINLATGWRACDGRRSNPLGGIWLIFIGSWLIGNATHAFGMTYQHSWPLLIIAGGIIIVLRELFPRLRESRQQGN
jgi:hypothetical protein